MRWIVVGLTLSTASPACAESYDHRARSSAQYKSGYLSAIGDYLTNIIDPADPHSISTAEGYTQCLQNSNEVSMVEHAGAYQARRPIQGYNPMVAVALGALKDMCQSHIDRAIAGSSRP